MMKRGMIFFLFPMGVVSFSLFGIWRPDNLTNIRINIKENVVVGTMEDNQSAVQMDIVHGSQSKRLRNLRLVKKPDDWYNFTKYKDYIYLFKKILQEQEGIQCDYSFLDHDKILVEPQIGEDKHQIILYRMDKNEKLF